MNKRILITGGNGFLGSAIGKALLDCGAEVFLLVRPDSDLTRVQDQRFKFVILDVSESLENALEMRSVNVVIHTACDYGRNDSTFSDLVNTNIWLGVRLLEAARNQGVLAFINTDTFLPKSLNPYALSKKQFTEWFSLLQSDLRIINCQVEHMYGPDDAGSKFIPWFLSQLSQGVARIPLTNGMQRRDFIHVRDVVSAYVVLLENLDILAPGLYEHEVGTGQSIAVKDFVEELFREYCIKHPGCKTQLGFGDLPLRHGEPPDLAVNNASLRQLGWKPEIDMKNGIQDLIRGLR